MLLFPHAKINVGLDIIGRRDDGYRLLETIMLHTDWEDMLELTPAVDGKTTLVCSGRPVNCPPEKNLVMKAYNLLNNVTGGLPPTRIHLHKNIPDGAGLGGGSADASYMLRGLNEMYNLGYGNDQLAAFAATLGADCPFFIFDEPMLCTGIGTELKPIELNAELHSLTLAIVKPDESVSTAEAYAGVQIRVPETSLLQQVQKPISEWQGNVVNAFENSVIPNHPAIGVIKQSLLAMGAIYASMSGSGSAVYGLFPKSDSDIMADLLIKKFPNTAVHVCKRL